MTIFLYLLVLFMNFIFAFRKRSSKLVIFISLIAILLFMAGAGPLYDGHNNSRDYLNYEISYNKARYINVFNKLEIGYTLLAKLGNYFNIDFFTFRMIIIFFCLLIMFRIAEKYTYNPSYFLLLYMLYPMIIDSEHFQNLIAMTILLVSISFLERNRKVDKIKFLLFIIVASSMHTAFLVYSSLIFVNNKNKNKLVRAIGIFATLFSMITFLNNNQIPFVSLALNYLNDKRLIGYLTSKTNYGFLIPVLLHLLNLFTVAWARKIIIKINLMEKMDSKFDELKLINTIYWINIIGISFFPLFMMSVTFYRLARNILILNFLVYSLASYKLKKGSHSNFIFNLIVIMCVNIWFILDLIIKTNPGRVLIPFFTRNLFFN